MCDSIVRVEVVTLKSNDWSRKMEIYEELRERGLIAQVTDEKEIRELINGN